MPDARKHNEIFTHDRTWCRMIHIAVRSCLTFTRSIDSQRANSRRPTGTAAAAAAGAAGAAGGSASELLSCIEQSEDDDESDDDDELSRSSQRAPCEFSENESAQRN